jgi:predicted nucleic acid-binding protein
MDRPAPSTPARDPSMRPRRRRFDEAIALAARELRESTRLALPDAVILATAKLRGADFVATRDLELLRTKSPPPSKRPDEIPLD